MQIMVGMPPDKKTREGRGYAEADRGMRHCFDEDLLGKFIVFLGTMKLHG
jgi:hypothetical protein